MNRGRKLKKEIGVLRQEGKDEGRRGGGKIMFGKAKMVTEEKMKKRETGKRKKLRREGRTPEWRP